MFAGRFGIALGSLALLAASPAPADTWIGSWTTSPTAPFDAATLSARKINPVIAAGTIRYRLRIARGGSAIRIKLANDYGETPLAIGAVSVGLAATGHDAVAGSLRPVLFGGARSIAIPPGAPVLSDPVQLKAGDGADLVVSIYLPDPLTVAERPIASPLEPVMLADKDVTGAERMADARPLGARPIVSAVDVLAEQSAGVVVALGDSITDACCRIANDERGWAGRLAARLATRGISVVNAGINGNLVLGSSANYGRNALARLDDDVLSVPGVNRIILLEGINDIGVSGRAADGIPPERDMAGLSDRLIAGYRQIITRAKSRGISVIGATILPFEGSGYYSPEKEAIRQTVNAWIRTSGAFDAVIDFDAITRDPAHPGRLRPEYDIGDHLHPSAAGHRAMGEAIDLKLFD